MKSYFKISYAVVEVYVPYMYKVLLSSSWAVIYQTKLKARSAYYFIHIYRKRKRGESREKQSKWGRLSLCIILATTTMKRTVSATTLSWYHKQSSLLSLSISSSSYHHFSHHHPLYSCPFSFEFCIKSYSAHFVYTPSIYRG